MKKRSFSELFAGLEGAKSRRGADADEDRKRAAVKDAEAEEGAEAGEDAEDEAEKPEEKRASAAERVGRALLSRLGGVSSMSDDELADAIISMWNDPGAFEGERGGAQTSAADVMARSGAAGERFAGVDPFGGKPSGPHVPIRSGAPADMPVDYEALTDRQFSELKRQLKRAAADGRKVRL